MSRIAAPDCVATHAPAPCPPGHRFGLYMELWNDDWTLPEGAKADALKKTLGLGDGATLLAGLLQRQLALVQALPSEHRLVVDARATAPFATGLGQEHPVENGFAFLTPYGLPYLAGSGVKGALRRAAQLLRDEGEQGFDAPMIDALFGPEDPGATDSGESLPADGRRRGALACWDVLPQPPNGELTVEIMTPHHGAYYEGKDSPHDAGQPNPIPIPFLALPAGSKLRFVITFEPALWPADLAGAEWQPIVERTLAHAFEWVGFGAKTAVGYGAMAVDSAAQAEREKAARAAQAEREKAARAAAKAKLDESRTPAQRAIADYVEAMQLACERLGGNKERPNGELHNRARQLARMAREGADWSRSDKRAAADAIQQWLPAVVRLQDEKDELKKLGLRALRAEN